MNMRAMILAAGLGTRLRPLTLVTPKPLLKVKGRALIDYNLSLLKKAGIRDVIVNLHHLGGQIKKHVGSGKKFGLRVSYSVEPKILGTGGGIKKAQGFFKGGPFIVINADTLIKIDLKRLVEHHLRKKAAATMVVRRLKSGEAYARLDIDNDGRLKGFGRGRYMYTGVQVLGPAIFKFLKRPSCLIETGYKRLLANGLPVRTFLYKGYWNDVGTMERLKSANGEM